jgi:hypothetical protein
MCDTDNVRKCQNQTPHFKVVIRVKDARKTCAKIGVVLLKIVTIVRCSTPSHK